MNIEKLEGKLIGGFCGFVVIKPDSKGLDIKINISHSGALIQEMIGNTGNATNSKQNPRYAKSTAANFISVIGDFITLTIDQSYSIVNKSSADYVSGFFGTGYIQTEPNNNPNPSIHLKNLTITSSYAHWNEINSKASANGIIAYMEGCSGGNANLPKTYYRKFDNITINPYNCSSGIPHNTDKNLVYLMSDKTNIPFAYVPPQTVNPNPEPDRNIGNFIPKYEIPRTPIPSPNNDNENKLFSSLSSKYWKESKCRLGGKDYNLAVLIDNIVEGCN